MKTQNYKTPTKLEKNVFKTIKLKKKIIQKSSKFRKTVTKVQKKPKIG